MDTRTSLPFDGVVPLLICPFTRNMLSPPQWSSHGRILETKNDRKSVHFGDWDGDGLCDVLVVDRPTGNVDMFRNTYRQGAEIPSFASPVRVVNSALCAPPDAKVDIHDLAVRFADLDGDGRVDVRAVLPEIKHAFLLTLV